MPDTITFSPGDIAYVEANFIVLNERPPGPGPSYIFGDGREFYPADYQEHEVDERRFKARMINEMQKHGMALDVESEWHAYLAGLYGVCLRHATPENIVRKEQLLARIDSLLSDLNAAVDALDSLEREFAPD